MYGQPVWNLLNIATPFPLVGPKCDRKILVSTSSMAWYLQATQAISWSSECSMKAQVPFFSPVLLAVLSNTSPCICWQMQRERLMELLNSVTLLMSWPSGFSTVPMTYVAPLSCMFTGPVLQTHQYNAECWPFDALAQVLLRGVVILNSSSEEVDDGELLWMSIFCSAAVLDAIFSA